MSDGSDLLQGFLFYHERTKRFYAEVLSGLDEWEVPAMFFGHVSRGLYSIDSLWTMKWVRQRIVPTDRQNLGSILRENGLKSYDEYKLLCIGEGRCAQDEEYIVRISFEALPDEIRQRLSQKVRDILPLSDNQLIVFFKDDMARLIDMNEIFNTRHEFARIQMERDMFANVRVSPEGFGIEWGEERSVGAEELRRCGTVSDLRYEDMLAFAKNRLVDTTGVGEYLGVTRQYISQLVVQQRLNPILSGDKSRMFLKAEIESM